MGTTTQSHKEEHQRAMGIGYFSISFSDFQNKRKKKADEAPETNAKMFVVNAELLCTCVAWYYSHWSNGNQTVHCGYMQQPNTYPHVHMCASYIPLLVNDKCESPLFQRDTSENDSLMAYFAIQTDALA